MKNRTTWDIVVTFICTNCTVLPFALPVSVMVVVQDLHPATLSAFGIT